MLGTVVAVYALAVPITGLQQIGVPSWFELVFNGAALVLAVAASKQLELLRERRARKARLRAFREDRETGFENRDRRPGPDRESRLMTVIAARWQGQRDVRIEAVPESQLRTLARPIGATA